ncbi:aromatic ring-hydroxylating oxygenase subunit alpha [Sphingobium sp.]|uniref:aromatic ring-hydroxylating oxygenase subunit alpha n=1 Tax=Sphingobium sp. TaxID=1912891 RepID=UPI003BB51D6B
MNREDLVEMAKHNIAHIKSNSVDQEEAILKVPASFYTDPARWEQEREKLFLRLPIVVALSSELNEPGAYRSVEIMDRPVLVVRQDDGSAQAFMNMCTHRGAQVVPVGNGKGSRFSCPYHGWTYGKAGNLIGVASPKEFGEIDKSCYGLPKLRTFEKSGFVWAILDPSATIAFDTFLSGYDEAIGAFGLDKWHVFGRKRLDSVNWKLMYDGYVDFYHLPVLHRATFGTKFSNQALNFRWGPHQRITTPDPTLLKLEGQPEAEWDLKSMLKGVWPMFPNAALISIDGRGSAMMFSQIFPGNSVLEGYSTHVFLTEKELTDEAEREAAEAQFTFLVEVLRDEDYTAAEGIQKNLLTGARDHILFGRNEPGGQAFHGWIDDIVNAQDDAEVTGLFERAHNRRYVADEKAVTA